MKKQIKTWLAFCLLFSLVFSAPLVTAEAANVNLETETQAFVFSPQSEHTLQIVGFYQVINRSASDFQGNVFFPLPKGYENIDPGYDPMLVQFGEQSLGVPVKVAANDTEGARGKYVSESSLVNREAVMEIEFPTAVTTLLLQFPGGVQDVTFLGNVTVQDAGVDANIHSYVAEKIQPGDKLEIHYMLKADGLETFERVLSEAKGESTSGATGNDQSTGNATTESQTNGTTSEVTRNSHRIKQIVFVTVLLRLIYVNELCSDWFLLLCLICNI